MAHKIFVFIPAFGQQISATTFLCTHALQGQFAAKNIQGGISTLSFPDIAELRSMAMTIWYDTMPDSSHLLFIDADMGFPPEMVIDMLLHDEPIVGTIYPQRKHPLSWAGSGTGTPVTERRGNFMLVEGVGMGCTLIRRDAIKLMVEKMPELIDTRLHLHPAGDTIRAAGSNRIIRAFEKIDLPDRGLVSEDLSFCIRWNQISGKNNVWAAIGYRISHVGPFDYAGRYLDMVEAQEREGQKQALDSAVTIGATPQYTQKQALDSAVTVGAMPQSNGGTAIGEPMQVAAQPADMTIPPLPQSEGETVPDEMKVAAE